MRSQEVPETTKPKRHLPVLTIEPAMEARVYFDLKRYATNYDTIRYGVLWHDVKWYHILMV